jgi:dihydrofolate reductase
MRKIIAGLFISLDGVVEAPNEWHFPYFNDEMGQEVGSLMAGNDTMLLGRQTYSEFASYWPHQSSDVPPADYMNNTPKLVVSNSLEAPLEWQNSTLVTGDAMEELRKIKAGPGRNIGVTGSGSLVRSMLRAGVLDELHLLIHPIAVGKGKRLFDNLDGQVPLKLVESRTFSTGVIAVTYVPADPA